jgi:hypothetical protein
MLRAVNLVRGEGRRYRRAKCKGHVNCNSNSNKRTKPAGLVVNEACDLQRNICRTSTYLQVRAIYEDATVLRIPPQHGHFIRPYVKIIRGT